MHSVAAQVRIPLKQNHQSMGCLLLLFRIVLCLHFLLFHFPSFSSSFSLHSLAPLCHADQSSALLQFKNSFFVDITDYASSLCNQPYPKTRTWENGTDCCSWMGVTCDSMSGHVIGLNLSCSGLEGKIHPNSTLFRLTHLQSLNLAHNEFDWSQLPPQLGGLVSLTHLNLSNCYISGDIPSQISHLSKLTSLDLSWNNGLKLKENTWKRLVQNATVLREIFLDYTNMSSISPNPLSLLAEWSSSSNLVTLSLVNTWMKGRLTSKIFCLPNLQELYLLGSQEIEWHLPMVNCSTSLNILDLSYCSLQGSVLSGFANLTRLSSLFLSNNNLNSSILSSLSNLHHLTHLDLSFNELGGIPSSLSNLQHLIHLDLSESQLNGQIPDVLGGLTKLQTLILWGNNLGGQLPSSLFTLPQLSYLDCSSNKFEGSLPNKITGFSYLTKLYLNGNLLNGTIPSWCLSLPSLTHLHLAYNKFTGHVDAISSYSLLSLDLRGNKLLGNIPESVFNLVNLTFLCLSSDNYDIPVHFPLFSKLQNLEFLFLSGYNSLSLISGINVNYSFSNLRSLQLPSNNLIDDPRFSGKFPKLEYLELSNSTLQGKVPKWIRDMDSLVYLKLPQNLLTSLDEFPWYKLEYLDLGSNLMTGDISSLFCNATSLRAINLSHNKFTGTFPQCLANFSSLEVLDLQMNNLHGTLPNTFSMNEDLRTLNLNGNQLEGQLPKSLSSCTELEDLNLGNNQLEDTFPHWLQNLPILRVLVLRANKLYGPIVRLKNKHPFPNKLYSKNVVEGEEKSDLVYMESYDGPRYFNFIEYDDSLIAKIKGVSTNFTKIPTVFVNIDLSENKFEGEIPNVIGELRGLKGLNFSHNRLSGHIPHSIGNLTSLESLDLSSNMLTGGIPIELTNLNSLEVLNLSHNNLVGAIPGGKQFNTFSNESYEGNIGLCGFPLSIKCNPEQLSPSSPTFQMEEKFGFGWKPVAIGYGCGMVLGVGLGCRVLLIGKPRWLIRMVGGDANKRVRRTRGIRTHGNRSRMA